MKIDSREYKVIIDGAVLADVESGLDRLLQDISRVGRETGIVVRDEFESDDPKNQFIRFLDTRDHALKANDLLLRQRVRWQSGKTEYTFKCRSPGYYIAAAKNVDAAKRFQDDAEGKLEDDINPPFVSKLSRSTTIKAPKRLAADNFPRTLAEASELFPGVLEVERNGRRCSPPS